MNTALQDRTVAEGALAANSPARRHELDRVAAFVSTLRTESLPGDVLARVRATLMDSLGVMLAGARETRVQQLAALLESRGSHGSSMVVSTGRRGDAADAALANATAACAQVLDEGHKYARGHVATYVLPAVLAVAEEQNASGSEFVAAFLAGYEVAARMGMACRVRESMHPSGTWGTVGAAAATARLMGFDAARIREAMTVAAPLTLATSWQAAVEGATVRDLYSGVGAANAVSAARWVSAGFTGAADDVANVFGRVSAESFDRDALVDGLGERFEILRSYFKVHACCRNFQSGIDAALELRKLHGVKTSDIGAIRAETFAVPARDNIDPEPRNVPAARESFPVSLALALIHGRCDQSVFTEEKVFDPEVRRIAAQVNVVCDPALDALMPDQRPSRITLTLGNGTALTAYAAVALGDPARPIPPAELEAKFWAAASDALEPHAAHALREAIARVETLGSIAELTHSLQFLRETR